LQTNIDSLSNLQKSDNTKQTLQTNINTVENDVKVIPINGYNLLLDDWSINL
jgi:hypothetical protein